MAAVEVGLHAVEAGLGAVAAAKVEMDGRCRGLMLAKGESEQMFEFCVVR